MIILVAEGQSARISGLDRNFNFKAQSKSASPRTEIEGYLTLKSSDTRGKKEKKKEGRKRTQESEIALFSGILQARLLLSSSFMNTFVFSIFIMCN